MDLLGDDGPAWPELRPWAAERTEIVAALRCALVEHGWSGHPGFGSTAYDVAEPPAQLVAALARLLVVHDRCSRAEVVWTLERRTEEAARLTAEREASHAVSAALDWTVASRSPSHAELVRRRAEVVVPR